MTSDVRAGPAPPPIDPRIIERRMKVRRFEGRRRLRLLIGATAASAIMVGGWVVTRSAALDVDRVRVDGAFHTPPSAVLHATGIREGMPMLDIDEAVASRRAEALPWVEDVAIRRRWPASVDITVRERVPVASVPAGPASWALVDATGRVLDLVMHRPLTLPLIEPPSPAAEVGHALDADAADLLEVAKVVRPSLIASLDAVVAAPDGVALRLRGGAVARLGPARQAADKLVAVESVLASAAPGPGAVIDARIPSSPVLTRGT